MEMSIVFCMFMGNHHKLRTANQLCLWAIFNSYVKLPEGNHQAWGHESTTMDIHSNIMNQRFPCKSACDDLPPRMTEAYVMGLEFWALAICDFILMLDSGSFQFSFLIKKTGSTATVSELWGRKTPDQDVQAEGTLCFHCIQITMPSYDMKSGRIHPLRSARKFEHQRFSEIAMGRAPTLRLDRYPTCINTFRIIFGRQKSQ